MRNYQKETAIIFIDFKQAFNSVDIKQTDSPCVLNPRDDRQSQKTKFNINTVVFHGNTLAPYLFIIILDYTLRTTIDDREGVTQTRRRSIRHPASHLCDLYYADDIALIADTLKEAALFTLLSGKCFQIY